jgi:glycosyltransferase involved in cell wall biosynthesis
MLSSARPRPSILIARSCAWSRPVNSPLVNCAPWSLLKIAGDPVLFASVSARSSQVIPNFVLDNVGVLQGDGQPWVNELPEGDFMLFVGALGRHKGLDVLLEAYTHLDAPPPLVLIGAEWPDTPTQFPPNVQVLKNWPHAAVMHAWSRCLFGLVPSVWAEPCPTVAMEAMALARPLIATRTGGLPDMVDDEISGLLVPPGDPTALAIAMSRLLEDAPLRARMGHAAQQKLPAFQTATVLSQIESVYQKACAAYNPKRRPSLRQPTRYKTYGPNGLKAYDNRAIGLGAIGTYGNLAQLLCLRQSSASARRNLRTQMEDT